MNTPNAAPDPVSLKEHAELTRRLSRKALAEGNDALARELERIADAAERQLSRAA